MSYIVVTDAIGKVIAFGPDDGSYSPTVPVGASVAIVENFTPPVRAAQLPRITPRQFRQALNQLELRSIVDDAVAAADQNTKDWYEYSTYFDRNNPVTLAMAAQLGKTAADLDALWKLGATL